MLTSASAGIWKSLGLRQPEIGSKTQAALSYYTGTCTRLVTGLTPYLILSDHVNLCHGFASHRLSEPAGAAVQLSGGSCCTHAVDTRTGFTSQFWRTLSARNTKQYIHSHEKTSQRLHSHGEDGAKLIGEQQHPSSQRLFLLCIYFVKYRAQCSFSSKYLRNPLPEVLCQNKKRKVITIWRQKNWQKGMGRGGRSRKYPKGWTSLSNITCLTKINTVIFLTGLSSRKSQIQPFRCIFMELLYKRSHEQCSLPESVHYSSMAMHAQQKKPSS